MMRFLLIFCLCGLVYTQEPVADDLPVEEVAVEDDFDVGRALEELLVEETDMAEDVDVMEGVKAIAPPVDDPSQVTPEVTEQFNRLTDVIISKVNIALRTKKLDPLSLNFQKNKKSKNKKKRQRRKRKRNNKKKNKKNRKTRDVTNLDDEEDLMEFEEEEDEEEQAIYLADEEDYDEESEEEDLERMRRDVVEDEEVEEEGDARKLGTKGKRKKSKKGKGRGKGKGKGKGKSKAKKSKKKGNKKRKSRKRRSSIVGVLSGLSTLKRQGDVVVQGEPGNSDIVADFTAGPVNLIAIRKVGKGKKQRRSKATVNVLKGRMVIRFSEGSSQISDIILYRPEEIDVDGALTKGKRKNTDAVMMKKVRQVNPIVAVKLKQVTRDVLQTIRIQ